MLRLVSTDPVGACLADRALVGLEDLARQLGAEGNARRAHRIRKQADNLRLVPVASFEESLLVAVRLNELADRYEYRGRPEVAEAYRCLVQLIRDRAFDRKLGRAC